MGLLGPHCEVSKGTEEFTKKFKVSFISENAVMCMGNTFPWETTRNLGKQAQNMSWIVLFVSPNFQWTRKIDI